MEHEEISVEREKAGRALIKRGKVLLRERRPCEGEGRIVKEQLMDENRAK